MPSRRIRLWMIEILIVRHVLWISQKKTLDNHPLVKPAVFHHVWAQDSDGKPSTHDPWEKVNGTHTNTTQKRMPTTANNPTNFVIVATKLPSWRRNHSKARKAAIVTPPYPCLLVVSQSSSLQFRISCHLGCSPPHGCYTHLCCLSSHLDFWSIRGRSNSSQESSPRWQHPAASCIGSSPPPPA